MPNLNGYIVAVKPRGKPWHIHADGMWVRLDGACKVARRTKTQPRIDMVWVIKITDGQFDKRIPL